VGAPGAFLQTTRSRIQMVSMYKIQFNIFI
jgi:hypothetical protein